MAVRGSSLVAERRRNVQCYGAFSLASRPPHDPFAYMVWLSKEADAVVLRRPETWENTSGPTNKLAVCTSYPGSTGKLCDATGSMIRHPFDPGCPFHPRRGSKG
jgi:hypothetical protein